MRDTADNRLEPANIRLPRKLLEELDRWTEDANRALHRQGTSFNINRSELIRLVLERAVIERPNWILPQSRASGTRTVYTDLESALAALERATFLYASPEIAMILVQRIESGKIIGAKRWTCMQSIEHSGGNPVMFKWIDDEEWVKLEYLRSL